MFVEEKDLVFRKLNQNDLDIFIKLRFAYLKETQNDIDQTKEKLLKISLKDYFNNHIFKNNEFIGIICEYKEIIISVAYLVIN